MLVVTHLSQEFKFQFTQHLSDAKNSYSYTVHVSFSMTDISLLIHIVFQCCYLAVSGRDHVYIVANELESEASVHQSKATLQRDKPSIS